MRKNVYREDKKSPATTYFSAVGSIIGAKELNFRVRDGNGWVLTSVFGMGTGGSSSLWSPDKLTNLFFPISYLSAVLFPASRESLQTRVNRKYGQASRSISIARLNTLLHLYLQPINRMFYPESLGDL